MGFPVNFLHTHFNVFGLHLPAKQNWNFNGQSFQEEQEQEQEKTKERKKIETRTFCVEHGKLNLCFEERKKSIPLIINAIAAGNCFFQAIKEN